MIKYYVVEIGGTLIDKRLDNFIDAVEKLAEEYGDIKINSIDEYYKDKYVIDKRRKSNKRVHKSNIVAA